MNRMIAITLALVLCLAMLAGCSPTTAPKPKADKPESTPSLPAASTQTQEVTPEPPMQESKIDAAALYTEYLVSGGYEDLLQVSDLESWTENWSVSTWQVDMNEDQLPELLVILTNEEFMGVRGKPTISALLAIQNEKVVVLSSCEFTGGTLGGEFMYAVNNEQQGKQTVGMFGYWRAGNEYYANTTEIYTYDGTSLSTCFTAEDGYFYIPTNQDEAIKDIQNKTDIYKIDGDSFYYWQADEQYVAEQDYLAATSCYKILHDAPQTGTFENPLNLS